MSIKTCLACKRNPRATMSFCAPCAAAWREWPDTNMAEFVKMIRLHTNISDPKIEGGK